MDSVTCLLAGRRQTQACPHPGRDAGGRPSTSLLHAWAVGSRSTTPRTRGPRPRHRGAGPTGVHAWRPDTPLPPSANPPCPQTLAPRPGPAPGPTARAGVHSRLLRGAPHRAGSLAHFPVGRALSRPLSGAGADGQPCRTLRGACSPLPGQCWDGRAAGRPRAWSGDGKEARFPGAPITQDGPTRAPVLPSWVLRAVTLGPLEPPGRGVSGFNLQPCRLTLDARHVCTGHLCLCHPWSRVSPTCGTGFLTLCLVSVFLLPGAESFVGAHGQFPGGPGPTCVLKSGKV